MEDINGYRLQDLIDIKLFQSLLDRLSGIYSFPSAIIDNDGNVLTASEWQDVCTKFHRVNPQSKKACIASDQYILEHINEANPSIIYKCAHGLIDTATPIIIEGVHYGNFFIGQFFFEQPDLEFFKKQAKKYGFDEGPYLDAIKKVPIWTKEQLNNYMFYIEGLIEVISGSALKNLRAIESNKALKKSETLYRDLVETAQDLIWQCDAEGRYIYLNQEWENVFGYKVEEMLGKKFAYFQTKEWAKKDLEEFSRLLKGNSIKGLETVHIGKDGSSINLVFNAKVVQNEKGEPLGTRGTAFNISESRKTEVALQDSEERYRTLFENINVGVALHEIVLDKKGKPVDFIFLDVNPKYEQITTLKKNDIIGKRVRDVIPNLEQKWIDLYGEVALTGKPVSIVDHSDFLDKYWDVKAYSPGKNQFAVALTDITERVTATNQLKVSEEKYKSLIFSSPLGMHIYQLEKDNQLIFVGTNPSADRMLGIKHEKLIGKTLEEAFPNLVQTEIPEMYRKVARGELGQQTFEIPYKDDRFSGYYRVDVFSNQANSTAVLFMDISDIRNAEIELSKAKEKAEESDRLKSAFLANMSHEIRTPMNGILGFANLLKSTKLGTEQQQKYISIIEKGGERLLNTINEIIDISKIESGQMSTTLSTVNVNDCLDELYGFFKLDAEKRGVELKLTKILTNKQARIKTDLEKLNSILTNLIKNALKYTNIGTIKFGYNLNKTKTEVEFYITDTGIGIPHDRQTAIFERFIQADIEDRMAHQGAGLGLAISKAYVEMLGGKIWVKSDPNIGSTFYFTQPYFKEESSDVPSSNIAKAKTVPTKIIKILITDDDETSTQLLETIVGSFAKEIIKVKTGKDAIAACKNNDDIDLVLMDIRMPEMNGCEATKKIREFNKNIIIIAQTAYALAGDRENSIEAGCNDYISKPIIKKELLEKIEKCLSGR